MRPSTISVFSVTFATLIALSHNARSVETAPRDAALPAGSAANASPRDPAVAQVGARTLRSASVARRLSELAPFQRRALGPSTKAQAEQLLERVLIPEVLLAEQGRRDGVTNQSQLEARRRAILKHLLLDKLRTEVVAQAEPNATEVRAYFDSHPELFAERERIRLQRLLVGTEGEARDLIAKMKTLPTMDDWRNLVREKSLDKATSERGGELGFVAADGSTDVPELEVDRALFAAAAKAKDGELLAEPVAEGKRFAVLWRRGSRPERSLDFATELPKIREYLTELAVEERLAALLVKLRKQSLSDYRPVALEGRNFDFIFAPAPTERDAKKAAPEPAPAAPPKP